MILEVESLQSRANGPGYYLDTETGELVQASETLELDPALILADEGAGRGTRPLIPLGIIAVLVGGFLLWRANT